MQSLGKLYVFEGPDGVGKTELSRLFSAWLRSRGDSTQLLTFPGSEEGTLGNFVYNIHHSPTRVGLGEVAQSSVQLLHIAAHVDLIERIILPAIRAGTTVVLDRYWWSTKVYGLAGGVDRKILDAMIDVELAAWGRVSPCFVFLLTRTAPLRPEPEALWHTWKRLYEDIAAEQKTRVTVVMIDNNGSIGSALDSITASLKQPQQYERSTSQLGLQFEIPAEERQAPYSFSAISPARPTIIYDTYWRFAAERQAIFFRRFRGLPTPWSADPIFGAYKFTNAYRASDRVSQYLIRKVIYGGDQSPEEVFFRTILFKLFNKIETWELLEKSLGRVAYRDFDFAACDRVLSEAMARNERIYSAAYIMPSGSTVFGTTRKHRAHMSLLEQMMEDEVPLRVAEAAGMLDAFTIIRSYPMMGDFLAYQYVTDLNYSNLTQFSEMEFVLPGPGAKSGISKCFESLGGLTEADLIRVVTERQELEFERLGITFASLWGRRLQLIDCQNLFCEVDKYSRVRHPEFPGASQRTRIKQKFRPSSQQLDYFYPPKWGINGALALGREGDGSDARVAG